MEDSIKTCWVTLTRECNLRCEWCYASGTGYKSSSSIKIENLFQICTLILNLGIEKVIFIGGEPTMYDNLLEAIHLFSSKGIRTSFITNGVKLADNNFVCQLQQAGLTRINLSLKGFNDDDFINVTGMDNFRDSIQAITVLSNHNIPFSVSMLLTPDNISNFLMGVEEAKAAGARKFTFSFCYDFSVLFKGCEERDEYDFNRNIFSVVGAFIQQYDELCDITDDEFTLSQSFPMCAWPKAFIKRMATKQQLNTVCQLLKHSGLIFDEELNIIPCHAMYPIKLGKFGVDFNNPIEFWNIWHSKEISEVFGKLQSLPSRKCATCEDLDVCGGGCVSHWFNFNFEAFEHARDCYYSNLKIER